MLMMLAQLVWIGGLRDSSALLILTMLAQLVWTVGLRDTLMLCMLAQLVLIGRPA